MKIIKTSKYIESLVDYKKDLAYELLDWDNGQCPDFILIGNAWLSGKEVPIRTIREVIEEIQEILEERIDYPRPLSNEDIDKLRDIQIKMEEQLDDQLYNMKRNY